MASASRSRWIRVNKHQPCPICKSLDWCSLCGNGTIAKCMRVAEGSYKSGTDVNGATFYLHRLDGTVRPDRPILRIAGEEFERADPEALHQVYSVILARLTLSQAHGEDLARRGLAPEAVERNQYRSLGKGNRARIGKELHERFGEKALKVPGVIIKSSEHGQYVTLKGPVGLVVPVRDFQGRICALKVRLDNRAEGQPKYVYMSSNGHGGPGPGSPCHVPIGTPTSDLERVRLTEGELKADVVSHQTGIPTISIPGAALWRPALAVLKEMGCRCVRLAWDADASSNSHVAKGLHGCAEALRGEGFSLELEKWAIEQGKGLDDLLLANGQAEVLTGDEVEEAIQDIVLTATAGDTEPEDEHLSRLKEVLDGGGEEALYRDKPLLEALAKLWRENVAAFNAILASIRERVHVSELKRALKKFVKQNKTATPEAVLGYLVEAGCICRRKVAAEGEEVVYPLSNFQGKIVEEVVHDDGVEQKRVLAVEGQPHDGTVLPRAEIPAPEFNGMGWVVPYWGPAAVVFAGQGIRDHLRAALQLLSGHVLRSIVYCHTGWSKIQNVWIYLHGGGGIGPSGPVKMLVSLPSELKGFDLTVLEGAPETSGSLDPKAISPNAQGAAPRNLPTTPTSASHLPGTRPPCPCLRGSEFQKENLIRACQPREALSPGNTRGQTIRYKSSEVVSLFKASSSLP